MKGSEQQKLKLVYPVGAAIRCELFSALPTEQEVTIFILFSGDIVGLNFKGVIFSLYFFFILCGFVIILYSPYPFYNLHEKI